MKDEYSNRKVELLVQCKCEFPWRARIHNKPLWLALILHHRSVKYRKGIIYLSEKV